MPTQITAGSRHSRLIVVIGLTAAMSAGWISARANSISQTSINECAANLLKAHRALIEDPSLRRTDEPLAAYVRRVSSPLPGESNDLYLIRIEGYVKALERAATAHELVVITPVLRDNSPANSESWRRIVSANLRFRSGAATVRALWFSGRTAKDPAEERKRLSLAITKTLLDLKAAFEGLRTVHP